MKQESKRIKSKIDILMKINFIDTSDKYISKTK